MQYEAQQPTGGESGACASCRLECPAESYNVKESINRLAPRFASTDLDIIPLRRMYPNPKILEYVG